MTLQTDFSNPTHYGHWYNPRPGGGQGYYIPSQYELAQDANELALQKEKGLADLRANEAKRSTPAVGLGRPSGTSGGGATGGGTLDYLSAGGSFNPAGGGAAPSQGIGRPGAVREMDRASYTTNPAWAAAAGGAGGGGNASKDLPYNALSDISSFLSRNPDTSEWDTTSAERAVAGGIGGSRMAAAEGSLYRQSEIDKRNKMGLELLEPYLNRQQDTWKTIEEGRQAMDRLRLSEAGQTARLTQEEKAKLEQIAAQGENALQIAVLNANTSRQNAQLGANTSLQNSMLSNNGANYRADLAANTAANKQTGPSSYAQSIIDQILRGSGGATSSPAPSANPGGIDSEYNPDSYDEWADEYA